MPRNHLMTRLVLASAVAGSLSAACSRHVSSTEVKSLFRDPPREFHTAPLWVWNDDLTDEQIVGTLRDLAGQEVRQVFVHPRPGLMTPYLSDEWFRLWKLALAEAERLDMNVWIYDENSYPSGFAGGLVPAAMPESRGQGLISREQAEPPAWSDSLVAVFQVDGDSYRNVTDRVKAADALPEGRYLVYSVQRAQPKAWHGGKTYVNLLTPGVTEKFIEITHEAYRREIGEHFGKRVPGVFTDEPEILPAGGLPWADDLPERFETRWGYPLIDHLPGLGQRLGDYRKVSHNYFQLCNELFIERWARPVHDWCEANGLEFTGHYWEHDWPMCLRVPDNMAMYAWHQRPAIDTLMNQYNESEHAQFGNVRAVMELASVANQLGKKRTLCEAYGAGGWDLRFEDMKRIGDWLYVLGVNTLDEHLSFITIRGARKRDHPQSFSYHEPWWKAYHVSASYFARLSAAMSQGEQVNEVLLIEPTTTVWMYNAWKDNTEKLHEIGGAFQDLVTRLAKAQVEFDLGSEDIIARHGSVTDGRFVVGERSYEIVVLPRHMENINRETLELIESYTAGGGKVVCCGSPPARVDGEAVYDAAFEATSKAWEYTTPLLLPDMLLDEADDAFRVHRAEGDQGILFHHRRRLADGEILFLVNTSIEHRSAGSVEAESGGVERWDIRTGETGDYPFQRTEAGVSCAFDLPPSGSLLLFLSNAKHETVSAEPPATVRTIEPIEPMKVMWTDPNVLTLDYVDVTAGGETRKGVYAPAAGTWVFKKHGFEQNPWDRSVQFRDELITKTFPPDSGFEATYRFTIREAVPENLEIVVERADSYEITCNGQPVAPETGPRSWWLDKSFGRVNIRETARVGENEVTIRSSPFRIFQELEAAYIIGDFKLEEAEKGFVIVPGNPRDLQPGPWNEQGMPLFGHRVSYVQRFQVDEPSGRYRVRLPAWRGSVARVNVVRARVSQARVTHADYIWCPPWECDVTEHIRPGWNEIEVIVIGTLKNTLGPHHGDPPLGLAWPHGFLNAPEEGPPPGSAYSSVGYGLFEPFVLEQVTAE